MKLKNRCGTSNGRTKCENMSSAKSDLRHSMTQRVKDESLKPIIVAQTGQQSSNKEKCCTHHARLIGFANLIIL